MFQELCEQDIRCPDSTALASQGDYEIFAEGEVGSGFPKSISAGTDSCSL